MPPWWRVGETDALRVLPLEEGRGSVARWAEEAADIASVEPGPMFQHTPHRRLGERLRELLHAVTEPGYRSDRLVTDSWANELGLRYWYEWKRLDEVT